MKKATVTILLFLFALSCKKDDCPTCLNGGTCIDGVCQCEGLWTGLNCETQLAPALIQIAAISVTQFPATDNAGAGWDLTSGPDVYVIVKADGQTILNTSADWRQNATFIETWQTPFSVDFAYSTIEIQLWDFDDFDPDDFMGSVIGKIYNNTNGFPDFVDITCAGCNVAFRLGPITYI